MDDILELILEIILEGAVGAAGSPKVPVWIRILLASVLLALFLGLFALLLWVGVDGGNMALVVLACLFLIGLIIYVAYRVRKHKK